MDEWTDKALRLKTIAWIIQREMMSSGRMKIKINDAYLPVSDAAPLTISVSSVVMAA